MAAPSDKTASDELAEYKAERARNWPSRVNVERKAAQLSDMQSRGELDLQADAHKRKLRLQQVLELQRRLGHFEASKECGALASAGDQPASDARKKQRQNEAPREKDHAIGVRQQQVASSTAEDESRRLREREAALERMRGAAKAPSTTGEAAAAKEEPAPAVRARGVATASQKHVKSEPAQSNPHAASQRKKSASLLTKLLASEIRRERSHLLQAFRFMSQTGLLKD